MELVRRVKDSLEATLDGAGSTPEEIAEQQAELIDMAAVIVDELGLTFSHISGEGAVLLEIVELFG